MGKAKKKKVIIRPLSDRLLVKRLEEDNVKKGGIIIPDTAKEKPQKAEVIAVGPGKRSDEGVLIAMDVSPGQHVLVGKYAGNEIEFDGEEYLILTQNEVLGIVE
jgi:chaperonin GroES